MTDPMARVRPNLAELDQLTTQLPGWIARGSVLGLIAAIGALLVYLLLLTRSETLAVQLIIAADPATQQDNGPGCGDKAGRVPSGTILVATGMLPAGTAERVKPGAPVRLVRSRLADARDLTLFGEVRAICLLSSERGYRLTVVVADPARSIDSQAGANRNSSTATGYIALGERRVASIIFSSVMQRLGWQV
jgi:hypothetical protein